MEDAVRIAGQILAGVMEPNLGCGLIAGIGQKLGLPPELDKFMVLDHEQHGHEGLGMTAESCVPQILEACRELTAPR
ncbi:hypothetical protein AB4059_12340 [Lysobacter sp. 2RAF19]